MAGANPPHTIHHPGPICRAHNEAKPHVHTLHRSRRLAGIEVLLQRLAAALPDCAWLHLVAQALAELLKDQGCKVRPRGWAGLLG